MSATLKGEDHNDRTKKTRGRQGDKPVVHEYTRGFWVTTNTKSDREEEVEAAAGVPRRYHPHPANSRALVKDINTMQSSGHDNLWKVKCIYSTDTGGKSEEGEGSDEPNPLLRKPEVWGGFKKYQRPAVGELVDKLISLQDIPEDIRAKGIVSSAGEPFDPPAMIDDSRPVLFVKRAEVNFNFSLASDYQDSINNDRFFGVAPRKAKLASISFSPIERFQGIPYRWITYEIDFRKEGFLLWLLDQGTFELKGGKRHPFAGENGQPIVRLLNGKGERNKDGAPAVFLPFKVYKERPFAALNLPQTLAAQ